MILKLKAVLDLLVERLKEQFIGYQLNHGIKAEVHLYDKLISDEKRVYLKDNSKSWEERINPTSLIKT